MQTPSMSKEEQERLGVDISLFQEGIIKPFKEHVILDAELYATNQKKQTRYTEEALLSAGTCVYNHDCAVEVIHKGDTKPLLAARDDAARSARSEAALAAAGPGDRALRRVEAKKRTGAHFLASKKPHEALLTFDDALAALGDVPAAHEGRAALEASVLLQSSMAALLLGQARRSRDDATACLALVDDGKTRQLALFRRGCARTILKDFAAADDDLADAGDAEAVHAARRKLRTKAAAAGVALARPAPPAAKPKPKPAPPAPPAPARARAPDAAPAAPAAPAVEEDVEDVPRLGADDGGDVEDVALGEWRGATDADREASWRDGEKFSHEQPVDWSSVTLPKGFPNPSEVSPISVVVLTNAGFEEKHALVALRVCRNELTKACDWLFKHKYAGDLDQVVRAFDKGDYDDERWNEEQFHAPKDAWVDEPGLPRAGDRVPGKGVQHPHDYDADKKGVAL